MLPVCCKSVTVVVAAVAYFLALNAYFKLLCLLWHLRIFGLLANLFIKFWCWPKADAWLHSLQLLLLLFV